MLNVKLQQIIQMIAIGTLFSQSIIVADALVGEGPRLKAKDRVTQDQIIANELTLQEIRRAGLLIFATPFSKADGYGDGPHDPLVADNRAAAAGNRPTLQGNGTFLRVNGLDAQSCQECHGVVSNRTVPATLGIGGVAGITSNAMFQSDAIDVADTDFDGAASFTGRMINPPFLYGAGGVELLAREMTDDLQNAKKRALDRPGQVMRLVTKGVDFGEIVADVDGVLDTSALEGIDEDLVIRPFGRKGDHASVRQFAVGALSFHMGMQAVEAFGGPDADDDNDGVSNEMSVGDLSSLSIFLTNMERPVEYRPGEHEQGLQLFEQVGCEDCHRRSLRTDSKMLGYKITGASDAPFDDIFYEADLSEEPAAFEVDNGGLVINLFSDLKRHDMGEDLAETFNKATAQQNRMYLTPRLWGIGDTAPYLHDGRAFTLVEAIMAHDNPGSEAAFAAEDFDALSDEQKNKLLNFLISLQAPEDPAKDLEELQSRDYRIRPNKFF